MMHYKRPASVPLGQVWRRFEGKEINGNPVWYQIRDMEECHKELCLNLMLDTFLRDEPLVIALDIVKDQESIESIKSNWLEILDQRISLSCFTEVDGQPDELVGFNVLLVKSKDDPEEDIEKVKGEPWKKLLKTLTKAENQVDIFEKYKVDKFLTSSGLTVLKEYRGQNIGAQIFAARVRAWAKFCWPEQDWLSIESLDELYLSCKMLCNKHFEDFYFTDDQKINLSPMSVPGKGDYIVHLLSSLRSDMNLIRCKDAAEKTTNMKDSETNNDYNSGHKHSHSHVNDHLQNVVGNENDHSHGPNHSHGNDLNSSSNFDHNPANSSSHRGDSGYGNDCSHVNAHVFEIDNNGSRHQNDRGHGNDSSHGNIQSHTIESNNEYGSIYDLTSTSCLLCNDSNPQVPPDAKKNQTQFVKPKNSLQDATITIGAPPLKKPRYEASIVCNTSNLASGAIANNENLAFHVSESLQPVQDNSDTLAINLISQMPSEPPQNVNLSDRTVVKQPRSYNKKPTKAERRRKLLAERQSCSNVQSINHLHSSRNRQTSRKSNHWYSSNSKSMQQNSNRVQSINTNNILPRVEQNNSQCMEPLIKTYKLAVKVGLITDITEKENNHLTEQEAEEVIEILEKAVEDEIENGSANHSAPVFRGKPKYTTNSLQLWCQNNYTLQWLNNIVQSVTLKTGARLITRKLSELPPRIKCGILIPKIQEAGDIARVLKYHNPWAEVGRWLLIAAQQQGSQTFLTLSIPQDIVNRIIQRKRRLGYYLGSVYVMFQGPEGKFYNTPPGSPIPVQQLFILQSSCKPFYKEIGEEMTLRVKSETKPFDKEDSNVFWMKEVIDLMEDSDNYSEEPLCKALGISATATVFTAVTSQVLAAKSGFELLAELPYSAMSKYGIDLRRSTTPTAKLMGKKFNF